MFGSGQDTDRKTQSLTVRVRDGAPDRQFASGSVLTHSLSLSPSSCCYSSGHLFVFCPNRDYESAVWGIERRDGIETADEMCDSQPGGGGGERKWLAEMRRFEKWQVRIKKGRRVRRKAVETGNTWWKSWKAFWTNRQRWKRKVYRKIYNLQGIIYTIVSSAPPAPLHPFVIFLAAVWQLSQTAKCSWPDQHGGVRTSAGNVYKIQNHQKPPHRLPTVVSS